MKRTAAFLLLALLAFSMSGVLYGQQHNIQNVNVNSLSETQIQKIIQEVNARGLSLEQAAALAKAQGASQQQIDDLINRISGSGQTQESAGFQQPVILQTQAVQVKEAVTAPEKAKKAFGFNLFNSQNLTFDPSVNIPAPKNYTLGIGDELTVNVWGASQRSYSLTIDRSGSAMIPDIGPVNLLGLSFEDAQQRLKSRLTSIYSGMAGSTPNTWAEVTLNNPRSIKINVVGDALLPGTYTLPATASVFNALYLSGGPNANGSFRNIQIIRDNAVIAVIDVYDFLLNGDTSGNITLREQDMIFIPVYNRKVETEGYFKRDAYFEIKDGETLSDLINYAGGFADNAYEGAVSIERITSTQRIVKDVESSHYADFILQNGDVITAKTIIDRFENRVSIDGAVFQPGTYELTPGLTLSKLIGKAQGVREDVFNNRGLLVRLQEDLTPSYIAFDVKEVLAGSGDIRLQREDAVIIRSISSLREERFVRIYGQVQNSGEFPYRENMTLGDLIFMAGGFTEAASNSYIELARRNDYEKSALITDKMVTVEKFDINRDLSLTDAQQSYVLKPFDYIYVRRAPSYFTQRTVTIKGEIMYPGDYSIESKNERVSDVLQRAGGLTPTAFIQGAVMHRRPTNQRELKKTLESSGESDIINTTEILTENDQLELRLADILKNPGSDYDYFLRDGDEIIIPEMQQEVRVSGEILNPMGLTYQPGKNLKYYVDRTGGFSTKAHKKKVFVLYSDGTTAVTKNFIFHKYPTLEPGAQIIVPEKQVKERPDQSSKWLAIASTMSSIAVSVSLIISRTAK